MKDYLKMHECFDMPLTTSELESGLFAIIQNSGLSIAAEFSCDAEVDAIEHAINSHDELVDMNKELLDIINRVINTSKELEGKAGASSWADGYKQCAIDTGSALSDMIDKYKSKVGAV